MSQNNVVWEVGGGGGGVGGVGGSMRVCVHACVCTLLLLSIFLVSDSEWFFSSVFH